MTVLCRHFGVCGGCQFQDMEAAAYRAFKRTLVIDALSKAGLADAKVDDVVAVSAKTRRRASLKVCKSEGSVRLGFHAAASHDVVDMTECLVLTPTLFALVSGLREMMAALLNDGEKAELFVTEAANGADVLIRWKKERTPHIVSAAARWAERLQLARLSANGGPLFLRESPFVEFAGTRVLLPVECFLQPTAEGESLLQAKVLEAAKGARAIADLFAGLGTFALPLARMAQVHAVEHDAEAIAALTDGARKGARLKPVTTAKRDLFKRPLTAGELAAYDLVVLDPPRVGALAQIRELARSKVRRIVYVSCNPQSYARDARVLVDAGFRMGTVTPIDQFLWSSHIEVVASFART